VRSYVPTGSVAEARLVEGLEAYSFPGLLALAEHLTSYGRVAPFQRDLSLDFPGDSLEVIDRAPGQHTGARFCWETR